jgi:DNA-binding XRE family transcriptional regulator
VTVTAAEFQAIRAAIASLPADVSNDAIGAQAPTLEALYAPETHAGALDPTTPIVQGARGTGKSFWAGVLGDDELRAAAAKAYPRLGLMCLVVQFGYTEIEGPLGIGRDKLDQCLPADAGIDEARVFFWATILRALASAAGQPPPSLPGLLTAARDVDTREARLSQTEVAARMGTSQSVVARLESGQIDARLSTLQRYAAAVGSELDLTVRPQEDPR